MVVYTLLSSFAAFLFITIPSKLVQISPNGLSNPLQRGILNVLVATVIESLTVVSGITRSLIPVKLPISLP